VKTRLDDGSKIAFGSIPPDQQWAYYLFKGGIIKKLESIKNGSYNLVQLNATIKDIINDEIKNNYTSIENIPTTELRNYISELVN
jgi:hypothetical protein